MFLLYNKRHCSHPYKTSLFWFDFVRLLTNTVEKWTIHKKLQLNEDKTEALLFDPSKSSDLPDVLRIGQSDIPFNYSARNLGVIFDNGLTMKLQIDRICQTACFEIRRIGSVRQFLTTEATKIFVTSLVLSRLHHCNSLSAGIPQKLVNKVQRVMNCAARLVCKAHKREHVSPLPVDLHWLFVERRIEYKIATICYNVITGTAPPYPPTSLSCTHHHALSAPLLTLASSVFRTDVKRSRDSAPFLSLVLPSGTISLSLCDMLKLCLPSNLS